MVNTAPQQARSGASLFEILLQVEAVAIAIILIVVAGTLLSHLEQMVDAIRRDQKIETQVLLDILAKLKR